MDQELIVRNSDLGLSLGLSYSFGLLLCKLRLSILPEEVDIRLVFFQRWAQYGAIRNIIVVLQYIAMTTISVLLVAIQYNTILTS